MTTHSAQSPMSVRGRSLAVALVTVLLAAFLPGAVAQAQSANRCDRRNNNTYQKLLECITEQGVFEHQQAFQEIADANDDEFYPGTRAAGTEGYDDSVDYVADLLRAAGWKVELDPVAVTFTLPSTLRQLTPEPEAEYETGAFTGSGSGTVEGQVIPVDLALGTAEWPTEPADSTSGCEAEDFAGIDWSGDDDIALVQRGACNFANKALNAENAGAEAIIIFNQGNTPGP